VVIVVIAFPGSFPCLAYHFSGNGMIISTIGMTVGTFVLAFFAFWTILEQGEAVKRNNKDLLLREIIDWIFDIKNVSLQPITSLEDKVINTNIMMGYGRLIPNIEYYRKAAQIFFKDSALEEKILLVGDKLIGLTVINFARRLNKEIVETDFASFPNATQLKNTLLNEYVEIMSKFRNEVKDNDSLKKAANNELFKKYASELVDAESALQSIILNKRCNLI